MSGIEVIKEVRKDSELPILILSAKTDDMDKIQGQSVVVMITSPSHLTHLK